MRRTTRIATVGSALALGFGALGVTVVAPASADAVWHQSVGRGTAEQACPESAAADLEIGWSSWGATWEEWVNDGTGGWACTRSITWARSGGGAGEGDPVVVSDYPQAQAQCEDAGGAFSVLDGARELYQCYFSPPLGGGWSEFETAAGTLCREAGGAGIRSENYPSADPPYQSVTCLPFS